MTYHTSRRYRRLYTLGYAGWTAEQVENLVCRQIDGFLADIRYSPQSRKPGFSRNQLSARLGGRYLWIPSLGNENFRGGPIRLSDPDYGLRQMSDLLKAGPVIVMCTCRRLQTCHRLTVAELAAERLGVAVEHLEGPPAFAGTVRCISLHQPWATLCCLPHPDDIHKPLQRAVKGFETRSWPTSYIGPLLIHAAKRNTREQREAFTWPLIRETLQTNGFSSPDDLAYGAVIGRVNLVGCHPARPIRQIIDAYALAMGNYDDGRYAWEINAPVLFAEPALYRGQQGFFGVPRSVLAGIHRATM